MPPTAAMGACNEAEPTTPAPIRAGTTAQAMRRGHARCGRMAAQSAAGKAAAAKAPAKFGLPKLDTNG